MKLISILSILLFVVFGVILGLLNPTSVNLNLFFIELTLPLSVIMSALLVFGMAIGGLIVFIQVVRLRWKLRSKTKENQKLSDQIVQLKKQNVEAKEKQVKQETSVQKLPAIEN